MNGTPDLTEQAKQMTAQAQLYGLTLDARKSHDERRWRERRKGNNLVRNRCAIEIKEDDQ